MPRAAGLCSREDAAVEAAGREDTSGLCGWARWKGAEPWLLIEIVMRLRDGA